MVVRGREPLLLERNDRQHSDVALCYRPRNFRCTDLISTIFFPALGAFSCVSKTEWSLLLLVLLAADTLRNMTGFCYLDRIEAASS